MISKRGIKETEKEEKEEKRGEKRGKEGRRRKEGEGLRGE